jgi:hypothetical protein
MGAGTTQEVVPFDTTLEPFAFACANDIDPFAHSEKADGYRLPLFNLWIFGAKFADKTERGQIVALEMPQLAACQALRLYFSETQLHGRIPIGFGQANLGNETWPSFDERYGNCHAISIENLGHADFLANEPFKHLGCLLRSIVPGLSAWAWLHHP